MKNKSIKGRHNIDKLCAEYTYKRVTCIQKSRTECLKGIVCIVVEGSVRQYFKFVEIVSQTLVETKAKVEVP